MTFFNKEVYKGNWINGERTGQGKYTYFDGSIYQGNWLKGIRQGQGDFTTATGVKTQGMWSNDRKNDYRILFVGDEAVGKSNIIYTLFGG